MIRRCLIVTSLFWFQCAFGQADSPDQDTLNRYKSIYFNVSSNYTAKLLHHVSPQEAAVIQRIEFRYVLSNTLAIADANIDANGNHYIEVSYAFQHLLEILMDVFSLTLEKGKTQCFGAFVVSVANTANYNLQAHATGLKTQLIPYFPDFIKTTNACSGLTNSDIRDPRNYGLVGPGMDAIMAFVLGHEVAHHVLGHIRPNKTLEQTRADEAAADKWSVEHSFSININPLPGLPIWVFFADLGGFDLSAEGRSTHPLGARRYEQALDIILEEMQSPGYEAQFGYKPTPDMLNMVREMRKDITRAVPALQ